MNALLALLQFELLGTEAWLWLLFLLVVVALLAFDLGVLNRKQREIGVRESLLLSAGYLGAGVAFGAWVWWQLGASAGAQFYTGFMLEKALALDNVFVIALIFSHLAIPRMYQHRVLFWGILGAIVLRAIMIGLGVALIEQFSWVMYVFAVFLLVTGVKMLFASEAPPAVEGNALLAILRRHLRVTEQPQGQAFLVRLPVSAAPGARKVLWATPLMVALIMIEAADLVFAVDSVPAILAVTQDPFLVYTSNIFAILGLRALYFALAAVLHRFHYLKYALALVLVFIGGKILYAQQFGKLDPTVSLTVTFTLLAGGVLLSLLRTRRSANAPGDLVSARIAS